MSEYRLAMHLFLLLTLSIFGQVFQLQGQTELNTYTHTQLVMGSRFDITLVGENEDWAQHNINTAIKEIQRIEQLISSWNDQSETSEVNRQAGKKWVSVSQELFQLIQRAIKVSDLTQGAFDITFGGLDKKIWQFDGSLTSLPDSATAAKSIRLINYKNIELDEVNKSVKLKKTGMRIGFGAIGKGYAAERTKALLLKKGVQSGIINAGGDLIAWGTQPDGSAWTIGIADPEGINKAFSWLEIHNQAVVTSGNYEKYVVIDGQRYGHIIDPRTGYPVGGLKSVTIICPNAELADALATAVFVMGKVSGLELINQLNDIECVIVDDSDRLLTSTGINVEERILLAK